MDNLREQLSNAMRSIDSGHAATLFDWYELGY